MDLLLVLGLSLSALGASAYALAYEHIQRQQRNNTRFSRIGKNGYTKYDRS